MAKRNFPQMGGNMNNMLRQMQKVQENMEKKQKEVEETVLEASSGGGMVNLKINGKKEIIELKIDKEVVDKDDVEMLEDLIISACNEGIRKADELMTSEMSKLTGGINIPGL